MNFEIEFVLCEYASQARKFYLPCNYKSSYLRDTFNKNFSVHFADHVFELTFQWFLNKQIWLFITRTQSCIAETMNSTKSIYN